MKKLIALVLAALLALGACATALAQTYTDKATVRAVQQALNDAGYNCGKPDGSAGKKTRSAIESYQTDKGLEVTGQIDDALLEAMGLAAEEAAESAEEVVESAEEVVESAEEALESMEEAAESAEEPLDYKKPEGFEQLFEGALASSMHEAGLDWNTVDMLFAPYILKPMYEENVSEDGTVLQEFANGKTAMLFQGVLLEDGQYGRPTHITYTLLGKADESMEAMEAVAMLAFAYSAHIAMGDADTTDAFIEEITQKMGMGTVGSDGRLSTAEWENDFYDNDDYSVKYEYINEGSKDYEQEIKLTFIAK